MGTSDIGIVALIVVAGFGIWQLAGCALEGLAHRKRLQALGREREAQLLIAEEQKRILGI